MLEANWIQDDRSGHKRTQEDVALERYVFVCLHEILLLKSAHDDAHGITPLPGGDSPDTTASGSSEKSSNIVRHLSEEQWRGVQDRLDALCLMPSYIVASSELKNEVDSWNFIEGLRTLTARRESQYRAEGYQEKKYSSISREWTVAGNEAPMLRDVASVMSRDPLQAGSESVPPNMTSSWISISLCTGCYTHGLLRLFKPLDGQMLKWSLGMLQRDLDRTQADMESGEANRPLWFWKVFTTAFAIEALCGFAAREGGIDKFLPGGMAAYRSLRKWFMKRIWLWSSVTGVTSWTDANNVLAAIVWPRIYDSEDLARRLWQASLATAPSSTPKVSSE